MLATLLLEIVVSRLLSVVTWYHLSFVAISVAMLGAAAGAVAVFVAPDRFPPARSTRDLALWAGRFAVALPISHLLSLVIPMPGGQEWTAMDVVTLALVLGVIAAPFAFGGIVTTLALTRTHAPVGRLYAADLLGAAAGCLAAVLLLDHANLSTAAFAAAALAATGAICFRRAAGLRIGIAVPGGAGIGNRGRGRQRRRRATPCRLSQEPARLAPARVAQPVEQPRAHPGVRARRRPAVLLGPPLAPRPSPPTSRWCWSTARPAPR